MKKRSFFYVKILSYFCILANCQKYPSELDVTLHQEQATATVSGRLVHVPNLFFITHARITEDTFTYDTYSDNDGYFKCTVPAGVVTLIIDDDDILRTTFENIKVEPYTNVSLGEINIWDRYPDEIIDFGFTSWHDRTGIFHESGHIWLKQSFGGDITLDMGENEGFIDFYQSSDIEISVSQVQSDRDGYVNVYISNDLCDTCWLDIGKVTPNSESTWTRKSFEIPGDDYITQYRYVKVECETNTGAMLEYIRIADN
ncbi:hypothetical protein JW935_15510 [candidate division KSB1 bacterium]|nr:hypothetical protein [candidate division KSB1 bacterium]